MKYKVLSINAPTDPHQIIVILTKFAQLRQIQPQFQTNCAIDSVKRSKYTREPNHDRFETRLN